ncbi:uncharacterized protein [Solanum lycopersicum]|uniref:uncharacterized protein n=1 Tax=Solanum lycopersicum TaxID=4081 RepID=UPI000276C66B|nr:putative GATA zinc finger domain-containing protein 25 [Solanum lycopersicum]
MQPNSFDVRNKIDEVVEGMDRGCQEKPTNLQEGVTIRRSLPYVLHEGLNTDYSPDFSACNNSRKEQQQEEQHQIQQQVQAGNSKQQKYAQNKEKQQDRNEDNEKDDKVDKKKDKGKQFDISKTESTFKSKNKPSKQKRDAAKRRQSMQQNSGDEKG